MKTSEIRKKEADRIKKLVLGKIKELKGKAREYNETTILFYDDEINNFEKEIKNIK